MHHLSRDPLALLAIGVFLTFRILDIADLTAEGTFYRRWDIISITEWSLAYLASPWAGGGMVAG